ncbi:MAG TPA: ABC transporter substrate-binding protein [Stellaceae bacterium]|nr:ABC transporter substrate-binding protein [Stellaceae bacterium]
MIRFHRIAAAAVAVLCAAGSAPAADTFDIHVIATLTGPAAFVGKYMKLNFEAFEAMVNDEGGIKGRKLRFVFDDGQSQPQLAVQLANDVIAEHPSVLMVTGPVANCAAVAPLLKDGPVMWCNSPALRPKPGSYAFASGPSGFDGFAALLRYFRSNGWIKVALLNTTDTTGQDADFYIDKDIALPENAGTMTLVAREHFNPSDLSVSAQIERIKSSGAQAMFAWTTGSPAATVFKGMIQAGLDIPVAPTGGNEVFQQLEQYKAFLPKGVVMASALFPPHDGIVALDPRVEKVQHEMYAVLAKRGMKADNNTADTWDAALITVAGLRALGPEASASQLRDWILAQKDFAGIDGLYDFTAAPERGLGSDTTTIVGYDPGGPDGPRWKWLSKIGGEPLAR